MGIFASASTSASALTSEQPVERGQFGSKPSHTTMGNFMSGENDEKCCFCFKRRCVMSQASCWATFLILLAGPAYILSFFFPWHASATAGPYGCSYDIRLNGGLSHIVHATCTDTPLGKTDGWLMNVQYTMNDYDENIASVVTLLFVSAVISVWALCTVGSDACCGFCCTGPNRCGLLMVPNILAASLGSAAGVLYLYGTKKQIDDWNADGIVAELPNGIVIPTLEFGKYIEFKWHMGLWLCAGAVTLHILAFFLSAFALCCSHRMYMGEEEWYGDEYYYEDGEEWEEEEEPAAVAGPAAGASLAEFAGVGKQDAGADDGSEMIQF